MYGYTRKECPRRERQQAARTGEKAVPTQAL